MPLAALMAVEVGAQIGEDISNDDPVLRMFWDVREVFAVWTTVEGRVWTARWVVPIYPRMASNTPWMVEYAAAGEVARIAPRICWARGSFGLRRSCPWAVSHPIILAYWRNAAAWMADMPSPTNRPAASSGVPEASGVPGRGSWPPISHHS